jgi:hypothetical protein
MPTELDIRAAERARLQSLVDEFGSECEQTQLVISRWRDGVPDPELLARLARRVERREKAGLPAVACAHEPPTRACTCLEFALDAAGGGSRRAILRRAAGFHWAPPLRTERAEPESRPALEEVAEPRATGRVEGPLPPLEPTPKPEPIFRVVKHLPRWYDDDRRFSDMTF